MAEAYRAYAPLDFLKPVADDIWIADGPEIGFRYFGLTLPFPTRMTVVRLPRGGLWLHSPIKPTETLVASLRALGPVHFLIAPNSLHYWFVPEWKARFPKAYVFAVPGLAKTAKRAVPIDQTLSDQPPRAWAGVLDQVLVPGSLLTEVDFFHRASATLILTDLIENFEPKRVKSWPLRTLMKTFGCADPDGKAPYDMQLSFWRTKPAVKAAVERMIAWAPERIILAHGRWYAHDGTAELRRAFRWVL
jgi:Domain of unknown function (DUF4336)